jgi:hypothetical protein
VVAAAASIRLILGLCVLALLASASASARPSAAQTFAIESVTVNAKWKEGWLRKGSSLVVRGTVDGVAQLKLVLRSGGSPGKVIRVTRKTVPQGGPFAATIVLPARPLPGLYKVSATGQSGGATLPRVDKDFLLPAPNTGIVDKAIVSARPGGRGVTVMRGLRHEVFVRFHFLTPPPKERTVSIVWRTPSYKYVCQTASGPVRGCKLTKKYAANITTFLRSSSQALQKGNWYCILSVGNTIAKRVAVRLR